MIKIVVYLDKKRNIHKFDISGHADFAKKGEDIVCAGVSALTYTLLNSMESVAEVKGLSTVKSGDVKYELPKDISQEQFEVSQIIFKTIAVGFRNMYGSYRKYIEYLEEEV